ncbi:MAG: hypothetical protein SGBAC_012152 [Bacillariaceae sp.]
MEDLEDADVDADADADAEEEETIEQGDFVFLEEDGTVEDKDGNVIDGVAMEDLEDLDADADEEELVVAGDQALGGSRTLPEGSLPTQTSKMNKQTATLNQADSDEDGEVIEFEQPIVIGNDEEEKNGDIGKGYKIAYASQEVLNVDPPAGMDFGGIDCPCCTFCLAAAAAAPPSANTENTRAAGVEKEDAAMDVDEPIGSAECVEAIQEGIATNEYPSLVGMNGLEAKKCLQINTDKTVILVRPGVRRHFPFQDTRIIVYLNKNGAVKKTPIVG